MHYERAWIRVPHPVGIGGGLGYSYLSNQCQNIEYHQDNDENAEQVLVIHFLNVSAPCFRGIMDLS